MHDAMTGQRLTGGEIDVLLCARRMLWAHGGALE
jgi:hypothetical protein